MWQVDKGAVVSPCGKFRFRLSRTWNHDLPRVNFVMLNPSTADHQSDDPTIVRCLGFARRWGYGGLCVTNLYAFRTAYPLELIENNFPIGPGNDVAIEEVALQCAAIVYAWGANAEPKRARAVRELLFWLPRPIFSLGTNKQGTPKHPLYLKNEAERVLW